LGGVILHNGIVSPASYWRRFTWLSGACNRCSGDPALYLIGQLGSRLLDQFIGLNHRDSTSHVLFSLGTVSYNNDLSQRSQVRRQSDIQSSLALNRHLLAHVSYEGKYQGGIVCYFYRK